MFIKKLELENWKCFKEKKIFNFNNHELIMAKNGTGKTSMFQGIIFAIYGKTPVGFNMNTIRNDPDKNASTYIEIEHNNSLISIYREFGSKSISTLKKDGSIICESIKSIEAYMNEIIDYKISNQLWTGNLIDSDISSYSYFENTILADILKDPNLVLSFFKSENYRLNKTINAFNEDVLDIKVIEKQINSIKTKLKKKNKNGDINKAKVAEEAANALKKITIENKNLTLDVANERIKLKKTSDEILRELDNEKKKEVNELLFLSQSEINKIIKLSEENNICLICGNNFNEKHKKEK